MGAEAKKLLNNIAILLTSSVVNKVISFFFGIVIARYFGSGDFGKYSFAIAIISLFIFIPDMGIPTLLVRDVSRDKLLANKYLMNSIIFRLILSFLTFILIAALMHFFFNYSRNIVILTLILSFTLIINAIGNSYERIYIAFEKMGYISAIAVVKNLMMLTSAVIVAIFKLDIIFFGFLYLIVNIVSLFCYVVDFPFRLFKPKFIMDTKLWGYFIRVGFPFAISSIMVGIYDKIDTVMIRMFYDDQSVGFYNAAYNILSSLYFIPVSIMGAMFPSASKYYKESQDRLKGIYKMSFEYLLILSIPLVAGGVILSRKIIFLLYTGMYEESVMALQVLLFTVIFAWLNVCMSNILNSMDRQRVVAILAVTGVIFNITLNLFLIPRYNFIGAAIATVLTEAILFFGGFYYISTLLMGIPALNMTLKPLLSTAIMGVSIFFLHNLSVLIIIPLSSVIYFISLYIIGGITKSDINFLREIVRR